MDDLITIRMRLAGGQQVAAEAQVVSGEIKGIGTETAAAGTAATTSGKKAERFGSTWSKVGRVVKLGALGAAGAIGGLALTAKSGLTDLLDLSKTAYGLHRNLGLTIKDGSRWASVAKARGIDTKSLTMTFATLSRNLRAAGQGSQTSLKLFHSLGITTADLKGSQGDFNQQLLLTAKGFGNTAGGAARMHAAQSLLGRGYQTILPLFAQGNKSLQEQLGWADKYHTTVTGKQLPDIEKLISAQRQSTLAWEGIKLSLGAAVLPLVTKANTEFQNLAAKLTDPHLTTQEKVTLLGKKLAQAAQYGFNAFITILPKIASNIGEHAPMIAAALIHGFLAANAWGKLALGAWLFTKLGLTGAVLGGIGKRISTRIAGSVAEGAGMQAAGASVGAILGPAIGVAAAAAAGVAFEQHFKDAILSLFGNRGASPSELRAAGINPNTMQWLSPKGAHSVTQTVPASHGPSGGATGGFVTGRGIAYRRTGGFIGGPRGTDTVPSWLTPGEGVVSVKGMARLGRVALAGLNEATVNPLGFGSPAGMAGAGPIHHQPIILQVDGKVLAQTTLRIGETAEARS